MLLDVIEGGAATIKDPRVDQLEGVVDRIATEWVLDESLERRKEGKIIPEPIDPGGVEVGECRVIVLAVFHWLSDMGLVR